MTREPPNELFTVSFTRHEKRLLVKLAHERGATMSGLLRRLLWEAANKSKITTEQSDNVGSIPNTGPGGQNG
jgi:hypothetical protein